jgi:filamentous hemagglutinin
VTSIQPQRLEKIPGPSWRLLALLLGLVLTLAAIVPGAPSAAAQNAVGAQPANLILTVRAQTAAGQTSIGVRGPPLHQTVSATGVAPETAGSDWPELSGVLRDAAKGKGNFGLGSATQEQAGAAGRAWVGDGASLASDGKTWISQDGLRQFRAPSYKPNLDQWQANFESRLVPRGAWQGNGHLDITDPP